MSAEVQEIQSLSSGAASRARDTDMPLDPQPLSDLTAELPSARVLGDAGVPVAGVTYRSTEVRPGWLFFCVPGTRVDGHDFAREAASAGAAVVMAERRLDLPQGVTQVLVPVVREAMGPVAAAHYGRPADHMVTTGVTGTSGKTTTTYLLERVFREAGLVPGVIGTTGVRIDGRQADKGLTTPEAPDLHRVLAQMSEAGVRAMAMEVSSHGLDQHRVGGVRYGCAVFTNLSQDHLDYHETMEEYLRAKAALFTPAMAERAAINHDSPEGRTLLHEDVPIITYGIGEGADVRAVDVESGAEGIRFRTTDGIVIRSPMLGAHTVYNCLAALAAARQLGIDAGAAARGIAALDAVPGRMERVEAGQPFTVVVDYSHKPGGLESALRSARSLAEGHRIIVVFGCGGDRDRAKRPVMGQVATTIADFTVITSDNPRSEDPGAIIAEIEPGARRGHGRFLVEPDRRLAIRVALGEAGAGDVVVIAGKGDETGQQFADRTIPFDDRQVAQVELEAMLGVKP
ncbi:MAG: UDP-N-acetylmuramoyl-L-alanyl-D-glutamate--2,6-diaminopimelate ligase [Actinomycetota bacterium]